MDRGCGKTVMMMGAGVSFLEILKWKGKAVCTEKNEIFVSLMTMVNVGEQLRHRNRR